jgi:glycine/D-amino acid oxidase-like deaminating enzyme
MRFSRRGVLTAGASFAGAIAAPGIAGLIGSDCGVEASAIRDISLWSKEIAGVPRQAIYSGERKVDLAIVGGGYTGLSCAYYAKKIRPDWNVIVLESHEIGSGASSRNTGAVYAKHVGINDPDMPKRGLARLRSFIDAEEIDCNFAPASTLTILASASQANDAKQNLEPGAKWISADRLATEAGTDFYAGAIDAPNYSKIHPAKLLTGTAKAALRLGVELFERSPVLDIKVGNPALLSTASGAIVADNVLIATNAYTPRLGIAKFKMFPLHQYSFATRKLTQSEISEFGLDLWDLRFEPETLPMTFSLTPSGHFFVRLVLGYASHDSTEWSDLEGARRYARRVFENRYPKIANIGLEHGWHGVTGHTTLFKQVAGPISKDGNIHISAAYNGLGIMPSHNNGYLSACRMTGAEDQDLHFLSGVSDQLFMPGDYYRSLMLKPFMAAMAPN